MLIKEIGEIYGARSQFFRDERQAEALPPEYFEYSTDDENPENKFGLRLYCIRANQSVVILLNGDLKTAQKASDCNKCKKHFDMANRIAARIHDGLREKSISFGDKTIPGFEDFEFEI